MADGRLRRGKSRTLGRDCADANPFKSLRWIRMQLTCMKSAAGFSGHTSAFYGCLT